MAVNLDILRQYLNHDEKMVTRFLHLFCTAVPNDLEKLKSYITAGDYSMSSITAHGIKTQCAYLGLEHPRSIAGEIEDITSPSPQLGAMVEELETLLQSEIAEMRMTMDI
jgi:HPt (histidine-containing phosphotransfer) domain-containing protein